MKLKTHLRSLLAASLLVTLCVTQASALEYGFDGAEDYLFADPTSQDVIYQEEDQNVNRSKTAALIAPGFGTPTSYLRGSGEYLTPNLAPGATYHKWGTAQFAEYLSAHGFAVFDQTVLGGSLAPLCCAMAKIKIS